MRVVTRILSAALLLASVSVPIAAVVSFPEVAEAQASHEAALVLRILAYDHNLPRRVHGQVTVIVLYQRGNGASQGAASQMISAINGLHTTVAGMPARAIAQAFTTSDALASFARSQRAAAIYVCPGLEDLAAAIAGAARATHTFSIATREVAVRGGLSVGILSHGSQLRLLVNLRAVQAEGAHLDPGLLRLAEVIR